MVCVRGGMCAHVASSEGCVFSVSARSVCAHVVGCCGLPVYLDFAVRVSACLRLKEVCACVLPVWRVCASYTVCSGGLGSVLVFPRDWVCTVVGPRSCALDSASVVCGV